MSVAAFCLIWPILFLAGLAVRRRNSRKTYSARLDSWALKYGLTRLDNEVMGRVEDIGLSARLSTEKGGDRSEHYLTVYTRFEPPLDLGLSIRSRHDLPLGNAGRFAVYTGDIAFDRSFYVYADEPGRATHLLTPALRHLLRRAHAGDGELLVTDQGIASQRFAHVSDDHGSNTVCTRYCKPHACLRAPRQDPRGGTVEEIRACVGAVRTAQRPLDPQGAARFVGPRERGASVRLRRTNR